MKSRNYRKEFDQIFNDTNRVNPTYSHAKLSPSEVYAKIDPRGYKIDLDDYTENCKGDEG